MALSDSFLQELKMKTDIEAVILTYVILKRRGATLVGLCPFHNEKTPSFTVYPATQSFYCFGCGAGGDAITFLKKIENLEEDINNKKAPKWAMEIDIDYIKAIKEIGNSSIHPNEGDIEKQKEIDQKLLNIVDIIFSELLDKIYEQPNRSKRNLEILYDKMKALNK